MTNAGSGHTRSCGCLQRRESSERFKTHGHKSDGKRSKTYVVWMNLKARCNNPSARLYSRYGGRGIGYAQEWESFEAFLRDMGEAPLSLTIDRIDSDGDYSKSNCRWATWKEQSNNRSNVKLYEWRGESRSVTDWARVVGIERLTIRHRLKAGWSIERALTVKPVWSARS